MNIYMYTYEKDGLNIYTHILFYSIYRYTYTYSSPWYSERLLSGFPLDTKTCNAHVPYIKWASVFS